MLSENKQIINEYCLCLNNIVSKYLAPEEGVERVFHIRFLCKRSKQYVKFKGLLHILMNLIIFYFFNFRLT